MNLFRHFLILLLRVYQWTLSPVLSAMFGPTGHCRFTPSCSQYAIEALQLHGVLRGGALSARRLLRCHPWGGCGHNPVPGAETADAIRPEQEAHLEPHALGAAARGR